MLAGNCTGCHGGNGGFAGPSIPVIAGQPAAYIVDALKKFRSGERPSTVMGRLAKGYTEQEIAAMAEFLARQKPMGGAAQEVDAGKVAVGKYYHRDAGCDQCHDNGAAGAKNLPSLAGQWLPYLEISLREFKSGKRPMPREMAEKLDALSDDQAEAVAHYYASQRQHPMEGKQ